MTNVVIMIRFLSISRDHLIEKKFLHDRFYFILMQSFISFQLMRLCFIKFIIHF